MTDDGTNTTPVADTGITVTPVEDVTTPTVVDSIANPVDPAVHDTPATVDVAAQADVIHAVVDHAYDVGGAAPVGDAVVSGNSTDEVHLSRCIYKNIHSRKSLTIHHLQRRLNNLGFTDAYADEDGWYGDLTQLSVKQFQTAKGFEATGVMDAQTFQEIFKDDVNVSIILE